MQIGNFALQILITGKPAREHGHDGRTYVVGRLGADYTLRLTNRTPRRVKAVPAVDGISVIDGKPAIKGGPGYVLEAYSTLDIPGWRISDEQVARFLFGRPEDGYASKLSRPENVGVIAAAFFEEVPPVVAESAIAKGSLLCGGSAANNSVLRSGEGSLGTGFGRKVDHAVRRVDFVSKPLPATVIEVRYEDAPILRGMGLDVDDDSVDIHTPEAFPGEGYCAPPSGWRG